MDRYYIRGSRVQREQKAGAPDSLREIKMGNISQENRRTEYISQREQLTQRPTYK